MGKAMMAPLALISLLAISSQPARADPRPAIKRCAGLPPLKAGQLGRTVPVVVPKPFNKVAKANRDVLAVSTMERVTICIDMRTKGNVAGYALSPDSRFFSFGWKGYEAQGHVLIDRSGGGKQLNTGAAPVFSPSRRRLAAVYQSQAALGELEGLGIWEVDPVGVREIGMVSNIPQMLDWRVDGWGGENCINLSAIPFSRYPDDGDLSRINRDRYTARPGATAWRVTRFIGKGC